MGYPEYRPRRLRRNERLRALVRENQLSVDHLVYPLFVREGGPDESPIPSMPGISQFSIDRVLREVEDLARLSVPAVLLFGIPSMKDELGSCAYDDNGIIQRTIRAIKQRFAKEILVIADLCLCEYTSHGHCGAIKNGDVDNDETLQLLARAAHAQASAGADVIAPSDMMDGRIGAVRKMLDTHNFSHVPIMSYAAKYASGLYGPFREAAESAPQFGDRRSYQMDPPNQREALREMELDIEEGADIIMVKPALFYLDILALAKERLNRPLAAYSVSGEYSMIKAAAAQGWIDYRRVVTEMAIGIKRAGGRYHNYLLCEGAGGMDEGVMRRSGEEERAGLNRQREGEAPSGRVHDVGHHPHHGSTDPGRSGDSPHPLRMIAWELTRNCNLDCVHCRARASAKCYENELSLDECKVLLDGVASFSSPTIILTGGEPLLRDDIYDIIRYGTSKSLRMVIAVNGTLVDRDAAVKLKEAGILRVSMSVDGKDQKSHDDFRRVSGSFDSVMQAGRLFNEVGMPFQINTTVTKMNVNDLGAIYDLVKGMGAVAWHVFLLVPVGRGEGLKGEELNAAMYEDVLNWLYEREERNEMEMKVTCAPHYYRIVKERGGTPKSAGCLAGKSFLFISHTGIAQPCGYLELPCGDVRKDGVRTVWEGSEQFALIRDFRQYKGKCGHCRFLKICGGCRARALELKGDILEAEPYCSYGETG